MMRPEQPELFSSEARHVERLDYLLDMIEQLATLARSMGERQIAVLLSATSEAHRLGARPRRRRYTHRNIAPHDC